MSWLAERAPGLHRFLTRRDRPWPLVREGLAAVLVIGALVGCLYGFTGQPFSGGYPVVVVTTGSMMHCTNYPDVASEFGKSCTPTIWGRLGSIDPGDLVFVRHISEATDVTVNAADGGGHYGRSGDVVVYRPNGSHAATPIIHRALFWVQVNADGTYSVPALHFDHISSLHQPAIDALVSDVPGSCDLTGAFTQSAHMFPEDASGFVTRGDNNRLADQCQAILPARLPWVLGKARGEVPWIGLVNLWWGDLQSGSNNFGNAGSDSKAMFFVVLAVLIVAPWVTERVLRRRARQRGV